MTDISQLSYRQEGNLLEDIIKNENHESRGRIIIVDDEPNLVSAMVEYLVEYCGYKVDYVNNAKDAFDVIKKANEAKTPYHLLISDIKMPEIDGPGLLEMLKGEPNLSNIHALFSSGNYTNEQENRIKSLGNYDILIKPFKITEYLPKIRDLVNQGKKLYSSNKSDSEILNDTHGGFLCGFPISQHYNGK